MISSNDFSHLKLLYERFLKMNFSIKDFLESEKFEDADILIQQKEVLLNEIISFEKPRLDDIKKNNELNTIRLKLIELEKNNFDLISTMKNNLSKELKEVKKTKKIIHAYEPKLGNNISTFEIKDDD